MTINHIKFMVLKSYLKKHRHRHLLMTVPVFLSIKWTFNKINSFSLYLLKSLINRYDIYTSKVHRILKWKLSDL